MILYNSEIKFKKHVSVDDDETTNIDLELSSIPTNQQIKEISGFRPMIDYWDVNIEKIFKKHNELQIAYAVLGNFRNSDRINFNKKALYLYIREMTNCKTQNITKVVNKMKDMQKKIQIDYKETGDVKNLCISKLYKKYVYSYCLMDTDEIFDGKTFASLAKDIYFNSTRKSAQIDQLIKDLRTMIKDAGSATIIAPMIKDYIDVSVKNDDQLVKLSALQRFLGGSSSSDEDSGLEVGVDNSEKEELRKV